MRTVGLQSWAEEEREVRRRCREERAELVATVEGLRGGGGGEEAVYLKERRLWREERAVCATTPTPLTPPPNLQPPTRFLQSLAVAKRDALRVRRAVEDVPSHPDLMQ